MKEIEVECTSCGHRFTVKVFEPGEAEEKRAPAYPIRCKKCGSGVRQIR
jgi:DNA-directed RNA polymerase subunit RPC12/RpoP